MDLTTETFDVPTLLVIAGPTAVGKTSFAIRLAKHFKTAIISADSRQFYKEMKIGTAAPTPEELAAVPHYFIGNLSIHDYYNISNYEHEVIALLSQLFKKHTVVILTGGSGLYIDAVCKGIDALPDPDPTIRAEIMELFYSEGIESIRNRLKLLDPDFYSQTDIANHKRLIRALEVSIQMGQPYSSLLTNQKKARQFKIKKYYLSLPRETLFERINRRTDLMMEQGWLEEAKQLYPYRKLNSLNTVGYKELFDYFDEKYSLEQAIEEIKTHTRRYAKKQLTWLKRDTEYCAITEF